MSSVNPVSESGLSLINQWLSSLSGGMSAQTIANTDPSLGAKVGNGIQLSAAVANGLKVISDASGGTLATVGSVGVLYSDIKSALNDYSSQGVISNETINNLVGDVSAVVSSGLMTSVALAQASGATTVALAGGTIALTDALGIVAATGAVAVVLGGIGLLPSNVNTSITSSAQLFSGLNFSDESSNITLSNIGITTSSKPDITTISNDQKTVAITWVTDVHSFTESTTYTSSARSEIASQTTTDVNSQSGQTTTTTINYNPDGTQCTFTQQTSPSIDLNTISSAVSGIENQDGVVQTLNVDHGNISATVSNAAILVNSDSTASIYGSHNNITTSNFESGNTTNAAIGVYGGDNTINVGGGALVGLNDTNGSFDTVNANGVGFGGTAANGLGTGIWLGQDVQANVNGSNNGISVASGDSMGAYGGGNTINAASNSLVVASGTNGSFDTINTNGNAFGGTVANGQGTGVWLNQDVQANVNGSNNGISVTSGDSMGSYGGGNTINATPNSVVVASGTNGSYDTINANGNSFGGTAANGQGTGVWLDKNVQANVNGNNIGISVTSGDSMGSYGGGNTINATPNSVVYVSGTNGSYDTINANGNSFGGTAANGQGTGVWLDKDVQAAVYGDYVGISATPDNSNAAPGSGGAIKISGANDTVNASNNQIKIGDNGRGGPVNINGDKNVISAANLAGASNWWNININGSSNTVASNYAVVNLTNTSENNQVLGTGNGVTGNWILNYISGNSLVPSSQDRTGSVAWIPYASGQPFPGKVDDIPLPSGTPTVTIGDPNGPPDETWTGPVPVSDGPGEQSVPINMTPDSIDPPDPIILNLQGNSVQTLSLENSSVFFDVKNDGEKYQTAWGTPGEGYLVYDPNDPNNTTVVTQDSQLVGGFSALQGLAQQADGIGHGILTASDALWGSLKVWVDTAGTGQFQSGELMSLDQLGIVSINLDGAQSDMSNNGNKVVVDSTFTRSDGSHGDIAGLGLAYNPRNSVNSVDAQVHNLISAMASYNASGSDSNFIKSEYEGSSVTLAASSH
ncbi:beta strand repeat-containing protein [Burkholderia gladioli]|uniref:beta strand repeat-containing protein n=1 Tax=Burkholderia gladioli TaxID=28095 RepID=UPI0016408182|nr:S-layer family protein [Burkholderia gladioli]